MGNKPRFSGNRIKAANNATLRADGSLLLDAQANTATQTSKNHSSSASIGLTASVGADGMKLGVTVAASLGRGHADGEDLAWTNTQVVAGNTAALQSGGDTTLKGAVVTAPRVDVEVGGNLHIQSLQDTSVYESKQQNISGSATFGPASGGNLSASQSQVDSTYTSVTEQTGIKAGDGGFGVQVNGKADLQGGVISSTEAAVQANQNTFTTTSLATSDLQNHAAYSANATGVSVGAGVSTDGKLAPSGTGVGIGHDSDSDSSVTQAGISGMAGNEAVRTGDKPTDIAKIFDAAKVEKDINAQVFITQTFSREAPRAIASYADSQVRDLQKQADTESDPARQSALQDDIRRWKEGGVYRVALHAASGGMAGSVGGAVGAGTVAAAAPLLDDWQTSLTDKLQAAGASESVAKAAATVIMQAAATGIGAVASGGSVQGAAAGLSTDANNRQLHPDEKIRIKQLAGKDAIKEARLTAAACSMTKCYAEFPTDSASYQQLKQLADIGASDALIGERQLLNQQSGLFGYSTSGVFNNANIDAAKQLNNTYQIDTRAIGAVQTVAGGFGIAGSAVTAPVSCATGIGCVANAVVGTVSIDTMYAGARQVVSGNPESTFLNQGLQGLGMSPEAAGLVEAALGVGSAVTAGAVANKAIDQSIALTKLSTASNQIFTTNGLKATEEVMKTPQARALIKEIQMGNPSMTKFWTQQNTLETILSLAHQFQRKELRHQGQLYSK